VLPSTVTSSKDTSVSVTLKSASPGVWPAPVVRVPPVWKKVAPLSDS